MGAKRSVEGRSRRYDDLLLDWQRANNPNFVEPVKRESKAEKKAQREREKQERKRLASEAAAAVGVEPSAAKKVSATTSSAKKASKKAAAAAAAAVRLAEGLGNEAPEDLDDLDSETELDDLVRSVRVAQEKKVIAIPLAVPRDAGSWFVQRRERVRCCRDLLVAALGNGGSGIQGQAIAMANRTASTGSVGTNVGLRV